MELKIIELNPKREEEIFKTPDCQSVLENYEQYYPKIGFYLPWIGYFVVRENIIVGCCGFTGKPKYGRVEIAYWTFKGFENQGISSFSCRELIKITQKADKTLTITAKTAPEQNASTKILKNNGFVFSELVQDEDIGDAWLWVLPK